MGQTFAEKVFSKKLGYNVRAGEFVEIEPDIAMSHDNTAAISFIFNEFGAEEIYNPDMHVIVLDHAAPPPTEIYATNHKVIREFARKHRIQNFFDVNTGICHQILPEEGFALPGAIIVGSDSHTTTYGAFGAFSTGIGRSEMAVIFATGKIWLRVPESTKITINGKLPEGVTSKDIILHIIGDMGGDGALYQSVEFTGEAISQLSISSRMTISNMSVEMGAKNGFIAPDEKLLAWIQDRQQYAYEAVVPDEDAHYAFHASYDVSDLEPQIACPHAVDNVKPISQVTGVKIDQVFLGSCTNGRLEDLEVAAGIVKNKSIHKDVRFLVFPASMTIYKEAMAQGYLATLSDAGAIIMNPGCGPCLGAYGGIMAPGEICLSSSNRNFKGRMGSPDAKIYLGSPASVTAGAISGEIIDFRNL